MIETPNAKPTTNGTVDVTVRWIFPKTRARLIQLNKIRAKMSCVVQKWHLLRLTNFGETGAMLDLMYFELAMEYERERYWFMKPINPLISAASIRGPARL